MEKLNSPGTKPYEYIMSLKLSLNKKNNNILIETKVWLEWSFSDIFIKKWYHLNNKFQNVVLSH